MVLKVESSQFSFDVNPIELEGVLNFAKSVMDSYIGDFIEPISVIHYNHIYCPMVFYEKGDQGEFIISLGSHDTQYGRYIYQFAHEYCHIRTNYHDNNLKLGWFEESICETSSLFFLDIMAPIWKNEVPYEHMREYDYILSDYSHNAKSLPEKTLPKDLSFQEWYTKQKIIFETAPFDKHNQRRNEYCIIAKQILPLFHQYPELWNLLTYWNKWELDSNDFIDNAFIKWLSILPEEKKSVAQKLINIFK